MFRHVELPTATAASILLIEVDPDTAEVANPGLSLESFRPHVATHQEQTTELLTFPTISLRYSGTSQHPLT